jgi:hypothetical protein
LPESPFFLLIVIFAIAWVLILAGAVVIFEFIVPFSYFHNYTDNILKGVMGTIVALFWLFAMVKMRDYFVEKRILKTGVSSV